MPGELIRLAGPGGGGKSQLGRQMLVDGDADVLADTTAIYAVLSGEERDADGRYPSRSDSALLLPTALYIRQTVVREALRRDLRVVKTSSTPTDLEADRALARELGAGFRQRIVDPGRVVIEGRLVNPRTGRLEPDCEQLINRWYLPSQTATFGPPQISRVPGARRVGGRVETPPARRPRRGRRRR